MTTLAKALVAGVHIYIAQKDRTLSLPGSVIKPPGSTATPTTVGRDAKPVYNDTTWQKLGIIASTEFDPGNETKISIMGSNPGHREAEQHLSVGQLMKISITCEEIQALTWQLIHGTTYIADNATQANPGSGCTGVDCWLKFQIYDNCDVLTDSGDLWGHISVKSPLTLANNANAKPVYEFMRARSALNTIS